MSLLHDLSRLRTGRRVLLRAQTVAPITRPPIENGAVLIAGNGIEAVGKWKPLSSSAPDETVDLGEVILLPGLLNAHCHLDYTDMAGQIPAPKGFSDWTKALLDLKERWSYSDFAVSWLRGAKMLLRHGTTTVANIEAVPLLLPEVRLATPLRVGSLLEMTGVRSKRPPGEILREAIDKIASLPPEASWAGLSPHALYSTTPELVRLASEAARERHWTVATHLAESAEEFEMFTAGSGPMFDWLNGQRDMTDCGSGSPVRCADRHGLLSENLLAVHVNYLAEGDAALLARSGTSVVHCPRSHAYFGHEPFPRKKLEAAGVNICLGTDSLASVQMRGREPAELNMPAEMQALAGRDPSLSPKAIVRMATINTAWALGLRGRLGELSPNALADLVAIPSAGNARKAYDQILQQNGPASAVMIGGRWVIEPGQGALTGGNPAE
jgi:aminodeoxyfutalosine deaminase